MEGTVVLVVQDKQFKCNKTDLIQNSDYFDAMFRGCFLERNQDIVELKVFFLSLLFM